MSDSKFAGCLGLSALATFPIVIGTLMRGWALSILWAWFVAPFFGLPDVSIAQAIGLSAIGQYLIGTNDIPKRSESDEDKSVTYLMIKGMAQTVVVPLGVVAFGWVVFQFIPQN